MSEHGATIVWRRTTPGFGSREYNTRHEWHFDGGAVVPASSAPAFRGEPDCVDPEEALVASLASCHMLWFLNLASRAGLVVDAYEDEAVAQMTKADDGMPWVSRVTLRPRVTFATGKAADEAQLARLHDESHRRCFVARSVKSEVVVEPRQG